MSTKTDARPFRSGFCNPSNPADSHGRCVGGYQGLTCCCTCHQAPITPPEAPAAATGETSTAHDTAPTSPTTPAGPVVTVGGMALTCDACGYAGVGTFLVQATTTGRTVRCGTCQRGAA